MCFNLISVSKLALNMEVFGDVLLYKKHNLKNEIKKIPLKYLCLMY